MLLPTTATGNIDYEQLLELLSEADTENDNDALAALRAAQTLLRQGETDWRELILQVWRFDLDNLPPLLRESDICRDPKRGYPGILPMTRSAFRTAVEDGYIKPPIKLGAKVVAWRREDILEIVRNGVVGRREQGRRAREREAQRRAQRAACSTETEPAKLPKPGAALRSRPRPRPQGGSSLNK